MSLDVYLKRKKWISYDAGKTLTEEDEIVYDANITHNLGEMVSEAGIYEALWRPYRLHKNYKDFGNDYQKEMEFEDSVEILAKDIIPILEEGLKKLENNPKHFEKFNSPNGWGLYENFVPFVKNYLNACKEFSDAIVEADR